MIYVNDPFGQWLPSFSVAAIGRTEMDENFVVKPLGRRQIDQAYPLVRLVAPGIAVEQWRAFAAAILKTGGLSAGQAGIMTVQDRQGYLHGLFSYVTEEHLRHGRVMSVDNFVVLDLFDVPGVTATLLHAMDSLARGLGCAAIHTTLSTRPLIDEAGSESATDPIAVCFHHEGHRRETVRLCKALDSVNDNQATDRGARHDTE